MLIGRDCIQQNNHYCLYITFNPAHNPVKYAFPNGCQNVLWENEKNSSLGHGPGSDLVGRHCPILYFQQIVVGICDVLQNGDLGALAEHGG